ncbi:MAG: hypothetical protein J0L56_20190 [Chitinophagales bacterium]|nr:hypothetical protein [Chitinophagales bacterium]
MQKILYHIILAFFLISIIACSTPGKNFATRYYNENKDMLDSIRNRFRNSYNNKPYHLQFEDRNFRYISFEILTDSTRQIYRFDLQEKDFTDTLEKYRYPAAEIIGLAADMQRIQCTWISKLDYYENREQKNLVFISIRSNRLKSLLSGEKYYALAFFNDRQFFDKQGRLTDKSERRRMREINGQVFHRITDRICYAITGNFR